MMQNLRLILIVLTLFALNGCNRETKVSMSSNFYVKIEDKNQFIKSRLVMNKNTYRDLTKPIIPESINVKGVNYNLSKFTISDVPEGFRIQFKWEILDNDNKSLKESKSEQKRTQIEIIKAICELLSINYSEVHVKEDSGECHGLKRKTLIL